MKEFNCIVQLALSMKANQTSDLISLNTHTHQKKGGGEKYKLVKISIACPQSALTLTASEFYHSSFPLIYHCIMASSVNVFMSVWNKLGNMLASRRQLDTFFIMQDKKYSFQQAASYLLPHPLNLLRSLAAKKLSWWTRHRKFLPALISTCCCRSLLLLRNIQECSPTFNTLLSDSGHNPNL